MKERFTRTRNGYSIEEVNRFVDEMTYAYSDILEKLKQKDEEISKLKSMLKDDDATRVYSSLVESEKLKRKAHNLVISKLDD